MTDQIIWLNAPGDVTQFHVEEHHHSEPPGDGEIKIRHEAIGTNFLDVYHRKGLYPMPSYPSVIGAEAAGIVEDVGPGVSLFQKGDRVAYAGPPVGAPPRGTWPPKGRSSFRMPFQRKRQRVRCSKA
ncbi:NADPH:quinone reductase-like Zn-dependent oxidoreductase [Rhizobium ruizarguesonis]